MDKYAVVIEDSFTKAASAVRVCPTCGSKAVDYSGPTPHCPKCGTKPWEAEWQDRKRK